MTGLFTTISSILLAIAASACCWLPSPLALATAVRSAGYQLGVTTGNAANERRSLAGHWLADVPLADGQTPKLVLDLDLLGSRWVGEFDVAEFGVENYPVKVVLAGNIVKLGFSAANANFEGKQSADRTRLVGVLELADQRIEVQFQRVGDAEFSESFLQLEAAADDSSSVHRLSASGTELRNRFNGDRDKVRLVMLLSPT